MARILVLSFSDLSADPRPDRQLEALAGHHELVAAGFGAPAGDRAQYIELRPPPDPLASRVNQAAGLSRIVARRYRAAYWGNRQVRTAYERLRDLRPDAVISNDVHTLPLALRVAGGAPVLADAHEYYPEHFIQVRWWRYVMAPYFDWLCREHMPLAAAVTTVSPGIAGLYRDRMGVEASLITNAPTRADLRPGPVGDPVRLFHHGSADPRRRLERTIEAMRLIDGRFELDLMLVGQDAWVERLRRAAAGDKRIRFRGAVPMREIPAVANSYDVGVFLLEPSSPNQLHVLPNKLFEFIQARLAVVIGPSPDMAALVRERGLGVVSDDFTPEAFARALESLDAATIARFKERSHAAAAELNAERNHDLILESVESMLSERAGRR